MTASKYMAMPQMKLTLNSNEYINEANVVVRVTRRENGLDYGAVDFADPDAQYWVAGFDAGDSALVQVKDEQETNYTTLLRGRIAPAIDPKISSAGDMLHFKLEGNGWPLAAMMVAAEYGSQVSASLDTVSEIANDVIDNYVEKMFSGAASGHTVNVEIDAATLTTTMRYLSYPYVPAYKTIDHMLETYQGYLGSGVGAHWMVDTSSTPKLYIQKIGAHSAQAVTDGWYNYLLNDSTAATFTQGEDFTQNNFQKHVKECNYLLYRGAWKYPCPNDIWAENNSADWDFFDVVAGGANPGEVNDDAADYVAGSKSIELKTADPVANEPTVVAWYPDTFDLNLNIEAVGGKLNQPSFVFWAKPDSYVAGIPAGSIPGISVPPFVIFSTGDPQPGGGGDGWYTYPFGNQLTNGKWSKVTIPIGPYSGCGVTGTPDWADIDAFGFYFCSNTTGQQATLNVDGPHFAGYVNRVVKQAAAYSSADPCIMKLVTDDYAKDDVIADNDKTGTISKLAYAEYLRGLSTPITGTFTTPMVKDLLPGQKIHVYAKYYKAGNSYRIDSDFRVTEFTHVCSPSGFFTEWIVTSDVTNTHSRPAWNSINKKLAAVRPGTQDMQAVSMNMREIDITQPRLVNTY